MHGGVIEVTGREGRLRSRLRLVLAVVPLALVVAALMPAAASADPKFDNGCRAQLTGEEGANEAELAIDCADFVVTEAIIRSNKDMLVFPLTPGEEEGGFICTPAGEREATCQGETDAATFRILTQDACGTEDNRPLVVDVELRGENETEFASITELQIQCAQEPPDDGDGDGDDGGPGAGEDQGQVPRGGVQSGAGGAAPPGGASVGLLALAGLIAAAMLGLAVARVRGST